MGNIRIVNPAIYAQSTILCYFYVNFVYLSRRQYGNIRLNNIGYNAITTMINIRNTRYKNRDFIKMQKALTLSQSFGYYFAYSESRNKEIIKYIIQELLKIYLEMIKYKE